MIRLIESGEQLPSFAPDAYFTRIAGVAAAYGYDTPFALFWRQIKENTEEETALVSSFDRNLTLFVKENADFDELSEFLAVIGGESLLCPAWAGERLGFSGGQLCTALKYVGAEIAPVETDEVRLDDLYDLLKSGEDGGITMPPRDSWYVDISHRIRHGAARVMAIGRNGKPAAAAVASAETDTAALISGVAVLPEFRGQNLGKQVVCALCETLKAEGKAAYVFARDEEKNFYLKCGFAPCGTAAEYIFCEE